MGQFPHQWEEDLFCPIYKKMAQHEPENYRPVCLLSHIRKVVDMAMLAEIKERYEPADSQFQLQGSTLVAQALIRTGDNAKGGLNHTAELYLEKAYDRVDRYTLLEVSKIWLHCRELPVEHVKRYVGPASNHDEMRSY